MLEETVTEETKPFLSHFYHSWHSIGVGRAPWASPWLRLWPQQSKKERTIATSWPLLATVKPPTLKPW